MNKLIGEIKLISRNVLAIVVHYSNFNLLYFLCACVNKTKEFRLLTKVILFSRIVDAMSR